MQLLASTTIAHILIMEVLKICKNDYFMVMMMMSTGTVSTGGCTSGSPSDGRFAR